MMCSTKLKEIKGGFLLKYSLGPKKSTYAIEGCKYFWSLMGNELIQAIVDGNSFTKFEENQLKLATARTHIYKI